jgi:hypothetical protein
MSAVIAFQPIEKQKTVERRDVGREDGVQALAVVVDVWEGDGGREAREVPREDTGVQKGVQTAELFERSADLRNKGLRKWWKCWKAYSPRATACDATDDVSVVDDNRMDGKRALRGQQTTSETTDDDRDDEILTRRT